MSNATQPASFRYQTSMTRHDWMLLGVLAIVSAVLWAWVWNEYQKPIVDPAWADQRVTVYSSLPPHTH